MISQIRRSSDGAFALRRPRAADQPLAPSSYELLEIIGRGGMSTVHRARHRETGRLIALKQPAGVSRRQRSTATKYFAHEAHVAESLDHPRIVAVHEHFKERGKPYLAMELIDGSSLRRLVGALTLPQIARVVEDLLAAIGHAGCAGIVHRDLKPENALVTNEGSIKVADFGLATIWGGSPSKLKTPTGTTVGTPQYMAPEQAMGRRVGPAADIYSIGVITYEMLTGRPPFTDAIPQRVLKRHVNEPLPDVRDTRSEIPESVARWVASMTRKIPDDRPHAADAWVGFETSMLQDVGPMWRQHTTIDPVPPPPEGPPSG